jgi:diguanylate cyclase (GGDEF)-like protein/PAS domain S-box-containing protein
VIARIPRSIRVAVLLGLAGLAAAVPFSNPDGTGMQWDELVLGAAATWVCWTLVRLSRPMATPAARPWRVMAVGAALFATAEWLQGAFPGPTFDGFGVDDVVLFAGACSPLVTCALLALRVSRTRWTALVVDGLMITLGLFVVSEVVSTPGIRPDDAPADLRSLVLMYGGYAAVMLGAAGVLCTVATRALRRSVSLMMGAVACQACAAVCEAMAILAPHPLWTAGSDVAVLLGLLLPLHAAGEAPLRDAGRGARAAAPQVSAAGMSLVVLGVLALPFALGLSLLAHQPLSSLAEVGCAVVFVLVAARIVLRIREDGRVSEDLVRNEEDFRDLVEASSDGVAIVDADARLLFTSPAARNLLDIVPDAEHEISLLGLFAGADRERLAAALRSGASAHVTLTTGDGTTRELEVVISERPGRDRHVVFLRDVTSRRRRERELERMAYTDHLTGLPNRVVLFQELGDAAALPGRRCLLVLDLDGFKEVNDSAGHEAGDHLLVEVARRLHTVVRADDLVARLGGDEFAVLVTGTLDESVEVARRVVDALGLPHRAGDRTFAIGASVGVAVVGAGGGQQAFRHADAALRRAKQAGKGCVRVAHDDVALAAAGGCDLAGALAEGAMTLRFDTACAPDGRPSLAHVVPVWQHPSLGSVRGVELWTAAAQQGATRVLLDWLLRWSCTSVSALDVGLVVSLAPGQVAPDGLADLVTAALEDSGFPGSRLVLSFTEETLMTSSAALVPELEAVRALGVRLCLDNYGMGQSLFGLMARVELDVVRADLAALSVRDDSERALRILDAIAHITSGFGLSVIAGGVSSEEIRETVARAGVQLLHGRAMPRDLDAAALAQLLSTTPVPPQRILGG